MSDEKFFLHHPSAHKIDKFIDKQLTYFTRERSYNKQFHSISYINSIKWLLCCTSLKHFTYGIHVHTSIWIDWYYLIIQLLHLCNHVTCTLRDVHLSILCVFLMEIDIHFICIPCVYNSANELFFWSSILVIKWYTNHDSFDLMNPYYFMWWNNIDKLYFLCVAIRRYCNLSLATKSQKL